MSSFESHRRELLALLRPAIDIAYSRGAIESAQRLGDATNRLKEGRLVTVVCGEFKRGKSTLLGALLDDPGLFPADVDIATNMVTSVGYGAAEMIEVVLAVAGAEQALTIDRDGIPQYVTEQGNPGNTRDVRLLTIKTPNQKLASGLTFFDTPGVGGLNQEHTAVTYGFLPAADAVVFVSDVTTPLSESELDFVRRISEYCPLILFVITKTDLRDDYADIVRNTRDKLAEVSGRPADDLLIIPVSSAAKLAYLRGGDGDDLELSNFPALEQTLREVLERRRGQILITRAATGFMRASEALALPIRTELQAARASASADLASLSADLETKERRIAELQQNGASWRQDLRKYIQELRYEIRRQLNYGLNRIWQRVPTTYLEDDRMLAQPTLIISALEADVGLLLGSLAERATQRAAVVQDRLEHETGLALARQAVGDVALPPVQFEILGQATKDGTGTDRVLRRLRDVKSSGSLGMTVGGLIGALLGGPAAPLTAPIGAAIGGLIAGGYGYRNAVKSARLHDQAARKDAIRSELVPVQNLHLAEGEGAMNEAIDMLLAAIEEDLDAKIRLESESVTAACQSLREAKTRSADQSAEVIARLTSEAELLDRGLDSCQAILKAITVQDAGQPSPAAGQPSPAS